MRYFCLINLIYIFFFTFSTLTAGEILLEAENADLSGVTIASDKEGYSGEGYVTGIDGQSDSIEFVFEASKGIYELVVGFSSPHGDKGYDFEVNGCSGSGLFPQNSSFSKVSAGKILMIDGKNSVTIRKGWGYFDIDYIKLIPSVTLIPEKPKLSLTDVNASPQAKNMYNFLLSIYGKKVLSGQESFADIGYIKKNTGKTPAVWGFDLIDYSPSRIKYGARPEGMTESWIEYEQENNCIVTLCWHWNAPAGLYNEPQKEWYFGFYTYATDFNIAEVLADTASERYSLLLDDIDAIAVQLKKFADKDIPVLWRPLHEASGGWFWWGARGPGPFKELWQLLYNRLVNVHQLHNLIWVYTSGKPEWYPGDDYVDIVSLDIYSGKGASMSGDWENLLGIYNGKKIITLSETGTLPEPDLVRTFNTWWSWFAVWEGDYIKKYSPEELRKVYEDKEILTLEELGNWRFYLK